MKHPATLDFSPRATTRWLIALTALAAALRALSLTAPPALTDEAFTFWRTCGSLGQMLDTLRRDAFVPLHYEIVWCVGRLLGHDIWALRLPAALAGIAMPWAMFRFARLLALGRRGGVIAAMLAITSPYFAFFSRNAKMYMPAWLCMMLAIGSVLAFAKAGRRLAILTFVFFGIAAGSSYALMLAPLALAPLLVVLFARRGHVRRALISLIALLFIALAPAIYYFAASEWFTHAGGLSGYVDGKPAPNDNGLDWIDEWQADRSAANTALECVSAYLIGYEWPGDARDNPRFESTLFVARIALAAIALCAAIGIVMLIGRPPRRIASVIAALALLILLPLYIFYLRSFRALSPPWELGGGAWIGLAVAVAIAWRSEKNRRRRFTATAWLAVPIIAMTIGWLVARQLYALAPRTPNGEPLWNNLWMPRYGAIVAPALLISLTAALVRIRPAVFRWLAVGAVCAIGLLVTGFDRFRETEAPWPLVWRDIVSASAPAARTQIAIGWIGLPFQRICPSLPGPYYDLVREARLDVDPPGFRDGFAWPYRTGPQVRELLRTLRIVPLQLLRPRAAQLIIWTIGDAPPNLPADWSCTQVERHVIYDIWDWSADAEYTRRVYEKRSG